MIKAPMGLQELRRRIYRKAKSDKTHRFWGIFVPIAKGETLEEAYRIAKRNGGTPGSAGQTFEDIEAVGLASLSGGSARRAYLRQVPTQAEPPSRYPKGRRQGRSLASPTAGCKGR